MPRATHEVADVIRLFGADLLRSEMVSPARRRVMRDLSACRTALLGGHVESCDSCDFDRIAYNSCRNRHCPKCQGARQAKWLEDRAHDLLPVEYFHVVFTLPDEIASIALQNKRELYGMLFRASAATLKVIAADERHLGAELGFVSVLHTWTQDLRHHPHVHCVVAGGGLSPDQSWVACRRGFFLPVRVLGAMFRGKFLAMLQSAYECGELQLQGALSPLQDASAFAACLDRVRAKRWVVYSKPPFGGPLQVLKYLARYTHRVAIGNGRILSVGGDGVSFRCRSRNQPGHSRVVHLPGKDFLRRFLLHVLPRGFPRIRHYGLLGNRSRKVKLAFCRLLLGAQMLAGPDRDVTPTEVEVHCPSCKVGLMVRQRLLTLSEPESVDSS